MRAGRLAWPLLLVAAGSCSGGKPEAPVARDSAALVAAPAPAAAPAKGKPGKGPKPASASRRAAAMDGGIDAEKPAPQVELKTEEREANPYSESVTLKLSVTPAVKATVLWGARQMAQLEPGKMDAEIKRPRGSGPLDLEIKAEGYLPHHTRLYADRNDKVGVRLHRVEDAPNLFGYRRSVEAKQLEGEKPEKQK